MLTKEFWTLNKLLILGLLGGIAFLLLEIRYEHREVLGEERTAWIPIIYSSLALVLGLVALYFWQQGGRLALAAIFAGAVIVGGLGVWFHTDGQPQQAVALVGTATRLLFSLASSGESAPGASEEAKGGSEEEGNSAEAEGAKSASSAETNGRPLLAPLAFCGLGFFGLLACSRRLPLEPAIPQNT